MESIRTALLVSLIIVLAIILYRRVLKKMGKKDNPVKYASILELESKGGEVTINIEMPKKGQMKVVVFHASDDRQLEVLADEEVASGKHGFTWKKPGEENDRFYCLLETSNLRSTRYFS